MDVEKIEDDFFGTIDIKTINRYRDLIDAMKSRVATLNKLDDKITRLAEKKKSAVEKIKTELSSYTKEFLDSRDLSLLEKFDTIQRNAATFEKSIREQILSERSRLENEKKTWQKKLYKNKQEIAAIINDLLLKRVEYIIKDNSTVLEKAGSVISIINKYSQLLDMRSMTEIIGKHKLNYREGAAAEIIYFSDKITENGYCSRSIKDGHFYPLTIINDFYKIVTGNKIPNKKGA